MASIDGLVSGMSTTDTINQLMQIEAAPQTALKNKITTANKVVTAYQSVNSRVSSLASAAAALDTASTWGAMKATANSDAVVVSAQPGAAAGSLSFRVGRLATTQIMTYDTTKVGGLDDTVVETDPDSGEGLIQLTDPNGGVTTLRAKDGTLRSVAAAINGSADLPYTAAAVQIGKGQYTLQLTAKTSGEKAATDMAAAGLPTNLIGGPTASVTAQGDDAVLTVGTLATYEIKSATNTFADVMPGVTVTAAKQQAPADAAVTVTVTADADGIAAKVQAMVDNANVLLGEIGSQSTAKTDTTAAGPLVGDSVMRKLSQDILSAVASGVPGVGTNGGTASFNDVGVGVDRYGKLTFDKQKFMDAYQADPAKTQKYFDSYTDVTRAGKGTEGKFEPGFDTANGVARKLETLALVAGEGVIDPTDPTKPKQGTLQTLIQRRNEVIRGLNDQVSEWDVRLEARRSALQLQFSNLEVALGKMQQQSSWLAGQLAGLS